MRLASAGKHITGSRRGKLATDCELILFLIGREIDVVSDWLDFGFSFLKITLCMPYQTKCFSVCFVNEFRS